MPPDFDVEMDPKAVREGHDPQLERAIEVVMELPRKKPHADLSQAAVRELPQAKCAVAHG